MRRVAGGLAALLLLAGCGPSAGGGDDFIVPQVQPARTIVDSPALRALKQQAGIVTCTPGAGHNDLPSGVVACLGGGRSVDLSGLKGPLIVNLWASWCVPCRAELPVYGDFARAHGDVVPVVGVDYEDTHPDNALRLLAASRASYPEFADTQGLFGGAALGHLSPDRILPLIVLVGADGSVVHVEATQIHSLDELEGLARQYLGATL